MRDIIECCGTALSRDKFYAQANATEGFYGWSNAVTETVTVNLGLTVAGSEGNVPGKSGKASHLG